jgi:hypothetical protein
MFLPGKVEREKRPVVLASVTGHLALKSLQAMNKNASGKTADGTD